MIVATISEKVDKSDTESVNEQGIPVPAYSVVSEPPSYKKATSASVRIARIVSFTVVLVALILGAAIIVAAYLQSRTHAAVTTTAATETNVKAAVAGLPSALKSESNKIDSSSEASTEDEEHKDGKRRLDNEADLLEEFLENEGKILRLPTGNDLDIDIDELTKMFLKRNPLDKSKCVVERKPLGGADDLIKVLPITAKNASALPLMPFVTGERVSIICSSDDDETSIEDDSGLIQSRPIAPFGMRPPPMMSHSMGHIGMPVNPVMSVMGPFPFAMNQSPVLPFLRNLRPMTPPFHLQQQQLQQQQLHQQQLHQQQLHQQQLINSIMAEQRNFNIPPPPMRNPFANLAAPRPLPHLPELTPNRPLFPMPQPPQSFQPPRPLFSAPIDRRVPFPMPMPENSQEKSHVPEQRVTIAPLDQNPLVPPPAPTTQRPAVRMPERPRPIIPGLPVGLLTLLRDLPHAGPTDQPPHQRLSIQPGQQSAPLFRIPKPLVNHPEPSEAPQDTPAQQPARPVTLPFLQVPPSAKDAPIPVSVPFLRIRPISARPNEEPSRSDRRLGSPSAFFERLIDTLLSNGPSRQAKSMKMPDSVPMEARNSAPIRSGSRGLRMPADGPVPDELVVARPVDSAEDEAPRQDRRGRSHFIQPRSVSEE